MRYLALAFTVALTSSGCLGLVVPEHKQVTVSSDMASQGGGQGDGTGNGTGTGGNATDDMGSLGPSGDGGAGVLTFGTICTTDGPTGDCASGMCKQFAGGAVHRCTSPCTYVSQTQPAPECPAPSAALCTTNGYCKFDQ